MSEMNPFIIYPLLILVVVGSFNYLYLYGSVDFGSSSEQSQELTQGQSLNESQTDIEMEQANFNFEFTMVTGLVAIIVIVMLISLLGASILGSHIFSETGLKMFYNGIVYYGLWAIFSAFCYTIIASIPSFGVLLWFFFTLIYSLGVFGKMGT